MAKKIYNFIVTVVVWGLSILALFGIFLWLLIENLLLILPNKFIMFIKKKSYDKVFHSECKVQKRERQRKN